MRIFAGNEVGQGADAVFSVPASGVVEVFFYGVVEGDIVGSKVACYVAVPYADTFFQGIERYAASYPLVGGAELEVYGVALAVFQFAQHGIIAEFVAAVHEFFQTEGCFLFGGHAVSGAETFAFTVKIMYGGTYYGLVCFAIVMHQGLPDYLFFGNTCFVTVLGKPCQ